jgi:hypothetical protein
MAIYINKQQQQQQQQQQDMDSSQPQQQQQQQQQLQAYYAQLTPFEQRTCDIARDHLGSSFDLARSNGYIRWLRKT